jgi:hypothetical protein
MTVVVNNRKNEKALLLQVLNTHTSLIILSVCCKANQTKYTKLHIHNFVAILEICIIVDNFSMKAVFVRCVPNVMYQLRKFSLFYP